MKNRKKRSILWLTPKKELEKIVKASDSFAQIIRSLKLQVGSAHYRTLKKRMDYDEINYSHIPQGKDSCKNRTFPRRTIPLEEIMVENSTYARQHLKNRLLKNGMLENKCFECGQGGEWQGKKLVMVLDHINGVNNDHRLDNLRMLCPNCNSQQDTFCGKHNKIKKYYCIDCNEEVTKKRKYCDKCLKKNNRLLHTKVHNRPSKEQLLKEIKEIGYCATGRKYGVSDNAVRKWLK